MEIEAIDKGKWGWFFLVIARPTGFGDYTSDGACHYMTKYNENLILVTRSNSIDEKLNGCYKEMTMSGDCVFTWSNFFFIDVILDWDGNKLTCSVWVGGDLLVITLINIKSSDNDTITSGTQKKEAKRTRMNTQ